MPDFKNKYKTEPRKKFAVPICVKSYLKVHISIPE